MNKKVLKRDNNETEEELQYLLYVVSHDLGKYVRHMHEFTNILLEESSQKFNEDELRYAEMLLRAARLSEEMIAALLEYSRIETQAEPFKTLSSVNLVQEAQKILSEKIRQSEAEIKISSLPDIVADEKQMILVWKHLLSNALTFVDKDTKPVINISAEEKKDMVVFLIKDNGIGIPVKFHERIFRLFTRLNPEDEYPGIGAGLAIAKRIIERHGGEIWLTSNHKKGTEFCFYLPRSVNKKEKAR